MIKEVQVHCKRADTGATEPTATVSVQVSWSAPEFREDGTKLESWEIGYYELHITDEDGNAAIHTAEHSPWRGDLGHGGYTVSMLVVDSGSLKSDMTDPIEFLVSDQQ